MDQRRLWLMDQKQYNQFNRNKRRLYFETYQKDVDDTLLIQYYVHNIIYFLRKRNFGTQSSFTPEKLIFTAISLFKRYYLVNPLYSQQPSQALICTIYISLKLNEYREDQIEKYAASWKKKKELEGAGKNLHYGQEQYSQKQLHFLQGIGFHIGRSPLIQPLEGLCQHIKAYMHDDYNKFERQIIDKLKIIYLDAYLLFLYPGPKVALSLVLLCLKQNNKYKNQEILGKDIMKVVQSNKSQIQKICEKIGKLQGFKVQNHSQELKQLRQLTKSKKKQFQKPQFSKKSPRFSGKSLNFPEPQ